MADSITVDVHKTPSISGDITPAEDCEGYTAKLTATIDATAASDYSLQWQKEKNGGWVDVSDGADGTATYAGATTNTLTITNTGVDQAGKYRLALTVNLPSCADNEDNGETSVTVILKPVATLVPPGNFTVKEGGLGTISVTETAPAASQYVKIAPVKTYEWWVMKPSTATYTKLTPSETALVQSGIVDQKSITFTGDVAFDSTLFYAVITTDCGTSTTNIDTLRIQDKFVITNIDGTPDLICTNKEAPAFTVTATATNMKQDLCYWQVSTDGTSWNKISQGDVPGQTGASYQIEMSENGSTYTLKVLNPTLAMNGWMFRVWATDGTGEADSTWDSGSVVKDIVLNVMAPPAFTCDNVLTNSNPVVVFGGTPASSAFTAGCLPDGSGYSYAYYKRYFTQTDSSQVGTGTNYTFNAVADTGIHYIYFVASNQCGRVYVKDSVRVIEMPVSDTITAINIDPNPDPDLDPSVKPAERVEKTDTKDFTMPVCEDHRLELVAPAPAVATGLVWEESADGNNWTAVSFSAPYSRRSDTLVIEPVSMLQQNRKYRCRFTMPGGVGFVYSPVVTVKVDFRPGRSIAGAVVVYDTIEMVVTDLTDPTLDNGQAKPGDEVELSVTSSVADATWYCFYQLKPKEWEEGEAVAFDTIPLNCGPTSTYTLTQDANVSDHDSTLYFARVYNDCGFSDSKIQLLRIFDTLQLVWIADTVFTYDDTWEDPLSPPVVNPTPGQVVVVISPADSTQLMAHLFLCENTYMAVHDTTLTGFINAEMGEDESYLEHRQSIWQYRESTDASWDFLTPDLVSIMLGGGQLNFTEHNGSILVDRVTKDMDGWQFKGKGLNALYQDSTCILTLHILPSIEKGDLELNPSDYDFCGGGDASFELTSKSDADLTKLAIEWQAKAVGAADWSVIDTMANRTLFDMGLVGVEYDGYEVRAVAAGACGTDTAYGIIHVSTPLAAEVEISGEATACFGEELLLTATGINAGNSPHYQWYVDGTAVPGETGTTFSMQDRQAGSYTVSVRLEADASGACIDPTVDVDSVMVTIHPRPAVTAGVEPDTIKTGVVANLTATGEQGLTYAWTPADLVKDPASAETETKPMENSGSFTFTVTATNEFGCTASDSVVLVVLSNFRLDSIPVTIVAPPVLPNDNGTMPGFPEDPYNNGTKVQELVFYNDTATLWVCPGNEAYIALATSGGEPLISYKWHIENGNGELFAPEGCREDVAFPTHDSIFGFFFPDKTTTQLTCLITDATGAELNAVVNVFYYEPENVYIEVRPKTTSGNYYEQQAIYFHAKPQSYPEYQWVKVANGTSEVSAPTKDPIFPAAFRMPEEADNEMWLTTLDNNGCRLWDSTHIELIKLPNVMIINDPNHPQADVIFPDFEVEITNMWGLRVKSFSQRNGNKQTKGWDGRTPSGVKVTAGTYYYRVKVPTLDGFMYVTGAVTVINK